jgi:hypothetical protein
MNAATGAVLSMPALQNMRTGFAIRVYVPSAFFIRLTGGLW